MYRFARIVGVALVAVACAASGGCTKDITITHYPTFYSPELRTIAVMPFDSLTSGAPAGVFFTDRMIDALVENASYQVVSGPQLLAELQASGLAMPSASATQPATQQASNRQPAAGHYVAVRAPAAGPALEQLIGAFRRRGGVDLVLLGHVTEFHAQPVLVQEAYPYGPYDPYPYPYSYPYPYPYYGPYGRGYYVSYTYQNRATAGAAVELYRVSDGRRLVASNDSAAVVSDGPDRLTLEQSIGRAAQEVARRLVRDIAPSPATIKVRTDQALETSRRADGGTLKETSTFARSDGAVIVTVRLPAAADRNPFTVTVTPENNANKVLLARSFTWSRSQTSQTVEVPIADLGGAGDYRVNLQQRDQTVLDKKITVK